MSEKESILVTGSNGQLGRSIESIAVDFPDYDFVFANRDLLDLNSSACIKDFFTKQRFDVIINAAAYTAVDEAERDSDLADQINHRAVHELADVVKKHRAKLVHVSTDYVFNGKQFTPYIETDHAEPQSVYGQSKLNGERAIQRTLKNNAVIIRTSWLYSEFGQNFIKTMLRLGKEKNSLNVVFDQVGSPTYAKDLAMAIMSILNAPTFKSQNFRTSVVHFSNEGICSWYDFAKTIFELSGIECHLYPIETKDYPTAAKRPHYSILSKALIKERYRLTIPHWKDSLRKCLAEMQVVGS